ncbi:MAG: ArsR/SmtB family transcription factor [Haloferacaceae archaeon]
MCNHSHDERVSDRMEQLQIIKGIAKALHCPKRWAIVDVIGTGTATTDEIRAALADRGDDLSKSGLYYHLSELSDAGIIEVEGYVEEGRGAPTKRWTLRTERIEIDLVDSEA